MAVFPRTESEVYGFAMTMLNGFDQYASLFPSVTLAMQTTLDQEISTFRAAIDGKESAKAAAKTATIAKDDAQESLEVFLRKLLKLAENDCVNNPQNLDYIGWSPRKEPTPLTAPGQPADFHPTFEGPGVLSLKWSKSSSGGLVRSYKIERSDLAAGGLPGPWTEITTTFDCNITLANQPRGIEMHYRVTAINPAGESMPSNIATAVL
jgi:hypothetical protein